MALILETFGAIFNQYSYRGDLLYMLVLSNAHYSY